MNLAPTTEIAGLSPDAATAPAVRSLSADVALPAPQVQLYRMLDDATANKPCIACSREEARRYNTPEHQYGVFLTVNAFNGRRLKENIERVQAVALDMDTGTKYQQADRLRSSPLTPTTIVETRRGYQPWWRVLDVHPEQWNALVLERLVPFYGADLRARDICRVLRAPGFLHLKDPADPFLCSVVFRSDATYRAAELLEAYPHVPPVAHVPSKPRTLATTGDDFWQAVYNLDCEEGLRRLSGHASVRGERFTFRRAPRGHLNIFVDGKGTSCFVDENRRIGSLDGGGPTLYAWLHWYGNTPAECVRVLKETFPELAEIDRKKR